MITPAFCSRTCLVSITLLATTQLWCSLSATAFDIDATLLCNPSSYADDDQFSVNLNTTLENVEMKAGEGRNLATDVQGDNPSKVYVKAECSGLLSSRTDCGECVRTGVEDMTNECPSKLGAQVMVNTACAIRYKNYDFISGLCSLPTSRPIACKHFPVIPIETPVHRYGILKINPHRGYLERVQLCPRG